MKGATAALLATMLALVGACDDGSDGADGTDGQDGAQGPAGPSGDSGSDGGTSLIVSSRLALGSTECPPGGVLIEAGVDTNGNGTLDSNEITATEVVCNGQTGGFGVFEPDPATAAISTRPLSSMMAVTLMPGSAFQSIPEYTKFLVDQYVQGELVLNGNFPLGAPSRNTDIAGVLMQGLEQNIVVRWFDPLTNDMTAEAPRFGANNDFLAYFGDGWDEEWPEGDVVGAGPMFGGSPDAGWMWSNFEYISNDEPMPLAAPEGQYLTLATFLSSNGLLDIADPTDDNLWTQELVDEHILWEKRNHGGGWFRVERQPNGAWALVPDDNAKRYDSTDSTLSFITGYTLAELDNDDSGNPLPEGVAVGITADCSGGVTPWGTVITAEENAQSQWGDLEDCWASDRQFQLDCPLYGEGQNINPDYSAADDSEFGRHSDANTKHNRDVYGFLVEIDVRQPSDDYYESVANGGDGLGHRKMGSMGRARWENVDIVTDTDQGLIDGQRIVLYGANDRRAGRVYKWVSEEPYTEGMTRGEVRALLDSGSLYVGHWEELDVLTGLTKYDPDDPDWDDCAGDDVLNSDNGASAVTAREACPALTEDDPGNGRWILLSTTSTDVAPNAAANGDGDETVGEALQDVTWNGVGGFPDDNAVLSSLFTAAGKLGVRELNRPEDVEWNPFDQKLYIAFTYHGRTIGMNQDGTLILRNVNGQNVSRDGTPYADGTGEPWTERGIVNLHSFVRADNFGSIFALVEDNQEDPAASSTFTFYPVWFGSQGNSAFDMARADNMAIDSEGGVWFGTDGNTSGSTNRSVDGIYYLDLDPSHREGEPGVVNATYGRGIRILHSANDSEATGPAFNSNEDTLFYNAQHPGEFRDSAWPSAQPELFR